MGTVINGTRIASMIMKEIRREVDSLRKYGTPGLATVLIGNRPDSKFYVDRKHQACQEAGIQSFHAGFPEDVSQGQVIKQLTEFRPNPDIHGILVKLPVPQHIRVDDLWDVMGVEKDVDGLHPYNIGKLSAGQYPLHIPCAAKGILEIFDRLALPISGQHAVVIGRSNIVGLPVAMMLLARDATVQLCHKHTPDVAICTRQADIVVAACRSPRMVKKEWVKPGAVVIDVGINTLYSAEVDRGYRVVGDVDFDEVRKVASAVTPVPGGCGPMTIAMLLRNTLDSAKRQWKSPSSPSLVSVNSFGV
eukprot:TRINITY_DN20526_c0_g1::TRINITY_DN20526_c0_g1_i1::g.75::m.75 TRINITY_DN20526_c0_g1::TRINITY_DN20526_c0_g1_i1::g.75  ORF type:complete len:304 (+),score=18.68,sp/Q9LHH7/FOLD2_ARATH/53.66/1e-103,THF_DHG_CYH_C/PF02882.14/6.7e-64,THF_DHG_CYH/PF00763.18/4.5e-30,OCD_Mu_crystall/PF02423.10/0.0018 TRINITY_DN20526_c0_g1_i1:29-940(+)